MVRRFKSISMIHALDGVTAVEYSERGRKKGFRFKRYNRVSWMYSWCYSCGDDGCGWCGECIKNNIK